MATISSSDPRYCVGNQKTCTWHGPVLQAAVKDHELCCPNCGQPVATASTSDDFWALIRRDSEILAAAFQRRQDASMGEYEAMMRWGQGQCFESQDVLVNAWRQANAALEAQV